MGKGWRDLLRSHPKLKAALLVGLLPLVLGAVFGILSILGAPRWAQLVALAGVVIVGIPPLVRELRGIVATEREDDAAKAAETVKQKADWERRVRAAIRWPLVPLSQMDPFDDLGVGKSKLADLFRGEERLAPFVRREAHQALAGQLQASGRLLIVGEPASGMTRTAYEVARDDGVDRLVLVPRSWAGLLEAVEDLDILSRIHRPVLLWLDRIDNLVDDGRLADAIKKVQKHASGSRVIATIPRGPYRIWSVEHHAVAEILDPFPLPRRPTQRERERAEAAYPDVDFSYGVAAASTAAAELLDRKRLGYGECPHEPADHRCSVAKSLVDLSLEWVETGTTRPLPVAAAASLLSSESGEEIDDEHLQCAVKWATASDTGPPLLIADAGDGPVALRPHAELGQGGPNPADLRLLLRAVAPGIVLLDDGTVVERADDPDTDLDDIPVVPA